MGKEYWYWGSATKSSKKAAPEKSDQPSSGCISSVFHLFYFHHFHHQPACTATTLTHLSLGHNKGGEVARNSLESLEESSASFPSSTGKEGENLKIPARVKTRTETRAKGVQALNNSISNFDSCSEFEINNSPGAKTPNLVARLMGLDLLPDHNNSASPSPSCRAKPRLDPRKLTRNQTTRYRNSVDGGDIAGIRSLPETPRISAARRSDVDYHHRLSLHLNKENYLSINEDENRSPRLYAKQRVKQIKESVARKVGIDITNTVKNRGQHQVKDELIGSQFKSQKISNKSAREEPAVHSSSPRSRILEPKNRTAIASSTQNVQIFKDSSRPAKKFKNDSSITTAKFDIRLRKPQQATDIIRNKQEEAFVRSPAGNRVDAYDKKCKKTPLSPHLLNISAPNFQRVKRACPPETEDPQKKESSEAQKSKPNRGSSPLSCSSSQAYNEEARHAHATQDGDRRYGGGSSTSATVGESAERDYVTNLLRRTGIDGNTAVSLATWFSPSRPLDPSVFYCIEDLGPAVKTTDIGHMGHRCNRKLVFDLVDVILTEFSMPHPNKKSWASSKPDLLLMNGTQLVEALLSKLRSFPQADCRVLEDIDALVEIDLHTEKVKNSIALEEEGEGIATAVEEEILERLIEETATEICRPMERYRFDG